jgi:hypothetical protein
MGSLAIEINSANGVKTFLHIKYGERPEEIFWKRDGGKRKKCLVYLSHGYRLDDRGVRV